jgi:hypothetical protein
MGSNEALDARHAKATGDHKALQLSRWCTLELRREPSVARAIAVKAHLERGVLVAVEIYTTCACCLPKPLQEATALGINQPNTKRPME